MAKKFVRVVTDEGRDEYVAVAKIVRVVPWPELTPGKVRTGVLGAGDNVLMVSSETPAAIVERIEAD